LNRGQIDALFNLLRANQGRPTGPPLQ
jgi:hypothetical protein